MTNPKKILVVEDEEAMRTALSDMIGFEGFTILGAKDGVEGLALARAEHPDLILLDILMPNMDGLEMLRELRADEWGRKVPVIVLSNVGEKEEIAQAVESNVFDYFVKTDIKITEVIAKIREKLGA